MQATDGAKTLYDLMDRVLTNDALDHEQKCALIDELRKNNPGASDRWTYRLAIYFLGGMTVLTIIGLIVIACLGAHAPQGLVAIGSASVGGLAGLLSPGRGKDA